MPDRTVLERVSRSPVMEMPASYFANPTLLHILIIPWASLELGVIEHVSSLILSSVHLPEDTWLIPWAGTGPWASVL